MANRKTYRRRNTGWKKTARKRKYTTAEKKEYYDNQARCHREWLNGYRDIKAADNLSAAKFAVSNGKALGYPKWKTDADKAYLRGLKARLAVGHFHEIAEK